MKSITVETIHFLQEQRFTDLQEAICKQDGLYIPDLICRLIIYINFNMNTNMDNGLTCFNKATFSVR